MSIHKLVRLADKFEGKLRKQAQGASEADPSPGAVSGAPTEGESTFDPTAFYRSPAEKKQSSAVSKLQKSLENFRSVANKELSKASRDYRNKVTRQKGPATSNLLDPDPVYQDYLRLGELVFSTSEPVIADGIIGKTTIKNINMVKKIPACFKARDSQDPVYKNIRETLAGSLMMQTISSLNKGTDSGLLKAADDLDKVTANLSIGIAIA